MSDAIREYPLRTLRVESQGALRAVRIMKESLFLCLSVTFRRSLARLGLSYPEGSKSSYTKGKR